MRPVGLSELADKPSAGKKNVEGVILTYPLIRYKIVCLKYLFCFLYFNANLRGC